MTLGVVVITYNRTALLAQALESVLRQTRPADALLVVDDGSTESTAALQQRVGDAVRWHRQENAGPSVARNTGLALSTTDTLLFLDDDDLLEPTALERLEAALVATPDAVLAYCRTRLIAEEGTVLEDLWPKQDAEGDVWDLLVQENFICMGAALVRRAALVAENGWLTTMRRNEDWDLWLRLAEKGTFARVREPLFSYRIRAGTLSHDRIAMADDAVRVLERQWERVADDPRRRSRVDDVLAICRRTGIAARREAFLQPLGLAIPAPPLRRIAPARDGAAPLLANIVPGLVSVLIPTYRRRDLLLRTLETIFAQTQVPVEVIVVDDGSPDDTSEALAPFIAAGRLRYLRQENAGQSTARNRGFAVCRGEFVTCIDDDDEWPEGHLPALLEALARHPEVGVAYGTAQPIDASGQEIPSPNPLLWPVVAPTGAVWSRFCERCWIMSVGQALLRRSAIEELIVRDGAFFDVAMGGADDWDLWLRLAERWEFVFVDRPSLRYRFHGNNMSRDISLQRMEAIAVYAKHAKRIAADPIRAQVLTYWRRRNVPTALWEIAQSALHEISIDPRAALRKLVWAVRRRPALLLRRSLWMGMIRSGFVPRSRAPLR
jgi:glycosyltransferase involved in cell wall biosynthesis